MDELRHKQIAADAPQQLARRLGGSWSDADEALRLPDGDVHLLIQGDEQGVVLTAISAARTGQGQGTLIVEALRELCADEQVLFVIGPIDNQRFFSTRRFTWLERPNLEWGFWAPAGHPLAASAA